MVKAVALAAVVGAVATVVGVKEMMVTGQAGELIIVSIIFAVLILVIVVVLALKVLLV